MEKGLIIDGIVSKLCEHFENNLQSVLLYGSSQNANKFWDLDIIVILKNKKDVISDLSFLKTVVRTFSEHLLDLQIFYADEITSPDTFSLDAHGAFFSKILSGATALYGTNPFIKFDPTEDIVTISLINRIQRYIFQARQEYIGTGRYSKDANPKYHQKHISRAIFDLMLMIEPCEDHVQAKEMFKKYFPKVISKKEWEQLEESSGEIVDYMLLYEKIYESSLEILKQLIPPKKLRLKRGEINGMVFEYIIPESHKASIIILDGLPRIPELSQFLNLLASWGYSVFFPRLKGTWESSGTFLDHDPTEEILNLAHSIREGLLLDNTLIKNSKIVVLGTSFSGPIALNTSTSEDILCSISFSPVYSMSAIPGVKTLNPFLKNAFGGAYRYSDEDWEKLLRDEIFSFKKVVENIKFNPNKCIIVAGENDDEIKISEIKNLCETYKINLHTLKLGHLSFHKNTRIIYPLLYRLLNEVV